MKLKNTGNIQFLYFFREFASEKDHNNHNDNADDTEIEFIEITPILNSNNADQEIQLPPHFRCAAHTLNLIAAKDIENASSTNAAYKKVSRSTFSKCQALWNKQNMSTVASDIIKDVFGVYLQTPCVTRWNSMFDSVHQIKKLLAIKSGEGVDMLDKCMDALGLARLQKHEVIFLKEYVEVN